MFNEQTYRKPTDIDAEAAALADMETEIQPRALTSEEVDAGLDESFDDSEKAGAFSKAFDKMREWAGRGKPVTPEDVKASLQAEAEERGEAVAIFTAEEDPFADLTIDPKNVEQSTKDVMEAMKAEMQTALEESAEALASGDVDKASRISKELANKMEAAGGDALAPEIKVMYEGVHSNLDQAIKEKNPEAKSRLYKFACGAMDFIPVAGPAKMVIEAGAGKTLGGDELSGWKRFLHGTEGVVFIAIDLTGFGAVASKLTKAGKSGLMSAKLLTRTAAFMRTIGVSRKVYKPVFNGGMFLMRHPKLASVATKGLKGVMTARKLNRTKDLPGLLKGSEPTAPEATAPEVLSAEGVAIQFPNPVADVSERPGMRLDAPPQEYALAS